MPSTGGMPSPALHVLRPLEPPDRDALAALFDRLSPTSRYRRFMGPKKVLSARELTYLTEIDHVTHEAIVAVDPGTGELAGVARYALAADGTPDFAIEVDDAWHGHGLGTRLTAALLARAVANGHTRMTASTLWENDPARCLLTKAGFRPTGVSHGVLDLELMLRSSAPAVGGSVGECSSAS